MDPAAEATVKRVEEQIQHSPMGWLQSKFAEVNSRAASEQGAVHGKIAESEKAVADNQKQAPPDAGAAPRPGPAAHPAVSTPASAGQHGAVKGGAAKKGGVHGATVAHAPASHGHAAPAHSAPAAGATPANLAQQLGGAANDGELDTMLNGYQPRSPQPTEMLGRIAQMKQVAAGFNGQLDIYVAQGGAVEQTIASVANALNLGTEARAVWAANPYRQMGGVLGGIMTGISAVKSVTGLVGSICGKLGMVLTIIGLLGMIFPPIGAAVSGIARILNVIGLICDAISFVLSGVLTGLNGVVLARQIAAGATAEEKAATADLLITEANNTAGGLVSLAMAFGPRFMKGLTGASRGVLGSLVRRFKTVVGRVTLRLTGNVRNFANRIARRLGFGGVGADRVGGAWKARPGLLTRAKEGLNKSWAGKAWQAPAKGIDRLQDKLMERFGTSKFAKGLDRIGARTGAIADKWDIDKRIGDASERLGNRVGGWGAGSARGQRMAAAADQAEAETRTVASQIAQQDAMHLEEARWRSHYAEQNAARRQSGRSEISQSVQDQHAGRMRAKVEAKHQADFLKSESERPRTIADKEWQQEIDRSHAQNYAKDRHYRDDTMRDLHTSRDQRWQLERQFENQEKERVRLQGLPQRSPAEEANLQRLNTELSRLDNARKLNLDLEGRHQKLTGHKEIEVHHAGDIHKNVDAAFDPLLEMAELRVTAAWRKGSLKKMHKWDKGSASSGSLKRGGHEEYAKIREALWREQSAGFAAFVAQGRPSPTVASTVRSMLSSVNRPAGAPASSSPTSATPTSATPAQPQQQTQQQPPAAPPQIQAQPPAGATPQQQPAQQQPAQEQTPQQATGMPAPVADADEGGADALPYWPALIPEFDRALSDFAFMRRVATEFKKAQLVGKQKAVNTLATYGRYEEFAKARAAQAKQNQTDSHATQQETQQNTQHAAAGAQQAGVGAGKQEQARGAANSRAGVDLPEPETSGFWGRILGAIKRWAKAKAAQVFGWIQEQVAGLVLRALCNVSMGDMREYANALRSQQGRGTEVAGTAAQTSAQAEQRSVKLGADAGKEAQSAADAIGECDRNIVEADGFMADVTTFEEQLRQEKLHAQTFLAQVRAAVHAEQARRRAEEAQHQEPAGADPGGPTNADPATADSTDAPPQQLADADADGVPDDAETEAARGQIQAAASYISDTVGQQKTEVENRAREYDNQLQLAMTNRAGSDGGGEAVAVRGHVFGLIGNRARLTGPSAEQARSVMSSFDEFVESTRQQMDSMRAMTIDASSAGQIADRVIQVATSVDTTYQLTLQALDDVYERAYGGLREGRRDLTTRLAGEGTALGSANDAVTDAGMGAWDTAHQPVDAAWDATVGRIVG